MIATPCCPFTTSLLLPTKVVVVWLTLLHLTHGRYFELAGNFDVRAYSVGERLQVSEDAERQAELSELHALTRSARQVGLVILRAPSYGHHHHLITPSCVLTQSPGTKSGDLSSCLHVAHTMRTCPLILSTNATTFTQRSPVTQLNPTRYHNRAAEPSRARAFEAISGNSRICTHAVGSTANQADVCAAHADRGGVWFEFDGWDGHARECTQAGRPSDGVAATHQATVSPTKQKGGSRGAIVVSQSSVTT